MALPVATPQTLDVLRNVKRNITLAGTVGTGGSLPLTFTVLTQPTHGTLVTSGASVVYTPTHDWVGADSFTFRVNDHIANSLAATITLNTAIILNSWQMNRVDLRITEEESQ